MNVTCEWCGDPVGGSRSYPRLLILPKEYGERKLRFHEKCLEQFKDANPNLMRKKEDEALQNNWS